MVLLGPGRSSTGLPPLLDLPAVLALNGASGFADVRTAFAVAVPFGGSAIVGEAVADADARTCQPFIGSAVRIFSFNTVELMPK